MYMKNKGLFALLGILCLVLVIAGFFCFKDRKDKELFKIENIGFNDKSNQYTLDDLIKINNLEFAFDFEKDKYTISCEVENISKYELSELEVKIVFLNNENRKIGERTIEIDKITKNSSKKILDEFTFENSNMIYDYKVIDAIGYRR